MCILGRMPVTLWRAAPAQAPRGGLIRGRVRSCERKLRVVEPLGRQDS